MLLSAGQSIYGVNRKPCISKHSGEVLQSVSEGFVVRVAGHRQAVIRYHQKDILSGFCVIKSRQSNGCPHRRGWPGITVAAYRILKSIKDIFGDFSAAGDIVVIAITITVNIGASTCGNAFVIDKSFQLSVGFDGELIFVIETGQQGGDGFSLVSEDEIVIAGFAFFLIQIEAAPFRFIWIFRILGIMKIAIVRKVRIEILLFVFDVILLIVAVL